MIINWERGTQIFGGSREIFESEVFNFINIVVPKNTQNAVNLVVENRQKELLQELKELQGSANVICAEILAQELNEFINEVENGKGGKKAKMQQVLICIDNVYRHVERKLNEPLDHSQLQNYKVNQKQIQDLFVKPVKFSNQINTSFLKRVLKCFKIFLLFKFQN